MRIKRYNLEDYLGLQFVHEQANGKFVLYKDHQAMVESIINDEAVLGDHNLIPSYDTEITTLRARLAEVEKEIADREEVEKSLTEWVARDGEKIKMLEARLAKVEAQRDGLKENLELVTSLWPSMEEIDNDRSGAWWSRPSAVYLLRRAREALAKLEEK